MKIYADGANVEDIKKLSKDPLIKGFTTNPTLMRKSGITDYIGFAKQILTFVNKPISFEVFSDDFDEMERQARIIAKWGSKVYVKIPITNTKGKSSVPLITKLSAAGVKINATALLTLEQVQSLRGAFKAPAIVSVFAGRIADTGEDPMPLMRAARHLTDAELLWASPREVLNIYQAEYVGCDIITCTPELIGKYRKMKNMNLDKLSLETVKMFHEDAKAAGYKL